MLSIDELNAKVKLFSHDGVIMLSNIDSGSMYGSDHTSRKSTSKISSIFEPYDHWVGETFVYDTFYFKCDIIPH